MERGTSKKLSPKFAGPHQIIWMKKNGSSAVIARFLDHTSTEMVSCERLIPVNEEMMVEDEDDEEAELVMLISPETNLTRGTEEEFLGQREE